MKGKKIIGVLLTMALLSSCNLFKKKQNDQQPEEDTGPDNTEVGRLVVDETFDSVTITNSEIRMVFDKTNGSLKSFVNMKTNNDYIKDSAGGNWAMLVAKDTDDVFEAKPTKGTNVMITSRNQSATFLKENNYHKEKETGWPKVEVLETLGTISEPLLNTLNYSTLRELPGLFLIVDVQKNNLRFNFWYHIHRFDITMIKEWADTFIAILKDTIKEE